MWFSAEHTQRPAVQPASSKPLADPLSHADFTPYRFGNRHLASLVNKTAQNDK